MDSRETAEYALSVVDGNGGYEGYVAADYLLSAFPSAYRSLAWKHLSHAKGTDVHCHGCDRFLNHEHQVRQCPKERCCWEMSHSNTNMRAHQAVRVAVCESMRGRRRRAREREAQGYHLPKDVKAITLAQEGRCYFCGCSLEKVKTAKDHLDAISRGGSQWPDNLAITCAPCNNNKNDDSEDTFWRRIKKTLDPAWIKERGSFLRRQRSLKRELRAQREADCGTKTRQKAPK